MERIVYLDRDALRAELGRPAFNHEWINYPNTAPEEVLDRLRDATIALTNKVELRREVLERLPGLKHISVTATGTNCVDLAACRELGIVVTNIRDWCTAAVAEHVFTLLLALRRRLLVSREQVRRGDWQTTQTWCVYPDEIPFELNGSTLGIIGHGALGQRVAALGTAFGMTPLIAERRTSPETRSGRTPFDEVLRLSDVLVLTCPLTPETHRLIGADELARMHPRALLVNCARGGLVDAAALVAALRAGTIAGAGIDVLEKEPPDDSNPLLNFDSPNLIVTPHIAWMSRTSADVMAQQIVENLEAYVAGSPRNVVV